MTLTPAHFVEAAETPFPQGGQALWLDRPNGARLRVGLFPKDDAVGWLVLLHGRGEFIEKYAEVILELHARGYSVATMDWRGQGLSSRPLADAPLKGHIDSFDTFFSDLDALWDETLRGHLGLTGPLPVLAHSMGGHISLRYAALRPQNVARVAVTAPMLDLPTMGMPKAVARSLVKVLRALRGPEPYFIGQGPSLPQDIQFAVNTVTKDKARFMTDIGWLKRCPELAIGGPSLGWVAAAIQSIEQTERPGFAKALSQPVLLVSAAGDRVVPPAAHGVFAERLPACTYVSIAGSEHEVLRERDEIRTQFWAAFDSFMAA